MPIQPPSAQGVSGTVVLAPQYKQGLTDLDGFSHIMLFYVFHLSTAFDLIVQPFMDEHKRGVFSTRAPCRPNPIGFSVVALKKIVDNILDIEGVDIVDGTPLLDIKPYVPAFDHPAHVRTGWLTDKLNHLQNRRADDRFHSKDA